MEPTSSAPCASLAVIEDDVLRDLPPPQIAARLNSTFAQFTQAQAIAASAGSMTVRAAVAMGQLLEEAFRRFEGDFAAWLAASVPHGEDSEPVISESTARRWRTLWKKRDLLFPPDGGEPTAKTLIEAYEKCGLIPARVPSDAPKGEAPLYRLQFSPPSVPPEKWPKATLLEFVQQTEPLFLVRQKALALLAE